MKSDEVEALVFDVFGTVVDWRTSVIEESAAFGARHGIDTDWPAFADEWRHAGYSGGMKRVASGDLPWMKVDALHRMKLDEMLSDLGVTSVSEDEIHRLSYVWHRQSWRTHTSPTRRHTRRLRICSVCRPNA